MGVSILDSFVPEYVEGGSVFVSVTSYGMTFSKSSVEVLGFPRTVKVYLDRSGKRFAVVPSEEAEGTRNCARDPGHPKSSFVRWNDKKLLNQLIAMGNLELGENGVRVQGEYVADENLLVFDLKKTQPIVGKNRRE